MHVFDLRNLCLITFMSSSHTWIVCCAGHLWLADQKATHHSTRFTCSYTLFDACVYLHILVQAIYGLGPGGNKGVPVTGGSRKKDAAKEDEEAGEDGEAEEGGEGGGGGGRGQQGGRGSTASGRGKGRQGFGFKEAHKSAIGNHHRKDRALRKMGM